MHDNTLKRGERIALLSLAGIAMLSVVFVFGVRAVGGGPSAPTLPALVTERSLLFLDGQDGDILVDDALTGHHVVTIGTSDAGFVRTALRAVAYNRRLSGAGAETPLTLGEAADGRLFLHDPVTEKLIKLDAFGDGNTAQFAALLKEGAVR